MDDDRGTAQGEGGGPHQRASSSLALAHQPLPALSGAVPALLRREAQAAGLFGLVFGQVVHQALAGFFRTGAEPAESFAALWKEAERVELRYSARETWQRLHETGRLLLAKFVADELPRIGNVTGTERAFELGITGIEEPFVGVIDLVAHVNGKKTVTDFKTSASSYAEHEVKLSDQLTAYQLAEPDAEQMALCVLVKTKEPKIEWHVSRRKPHDLLDYLAKAGYVAREIAAGRFYKRPGMWCAWCDFLPVCLGDERKVAKTLVRTG
jgi:PD-(D/E)XK nuclease superfamily